ncbi:S8 family peptidase [Brevibacillus fortis]|uniref:Peptidase S8 n=1 Tax=Brevibacillus fortis TaxID=2126352 RepID=A0A2P7UQU8_9BACL|nr:S8 family serine peptidase [Brevibacillus fortis]PSJ89317.1 peptidase S8 [Brevibacillus fortis]
MKKRTGKWWAMGLLSSALVMSVFTGVGTASNDSTNEFSELGTARVLIQSDSDVRNGFFAEPLEVRHDFGEDGFTLDVNSDQLDQLKSDPNVKITVLQKLKIAEYIEEDQANELEFSPAAVVPWGIKAIYKNQSLSATTGGSDVRVAVLDTGVFTQHPDLVANAEQCNDFTQASPVVTGACNDAHGHGTHVAGTVLANGGDGAGIYGVAPDSKLWAYKVLDDSGSGYEDDIAYAIRYAADQSAQLGVKTIVSMSLGSSRKSALMDSAITYANQNGVLVVAAAGNSGPTVNSIGFPGALVNTVAVAALENVQQNGTYRVADFSSRGKSGQAGDYVIQERDVEVSAPGRAIQSTWNNGGYNSISGTSMATPHISGLAAKIWASNPSWSYQDVRVELQNRATSNDIKGGSNSTTGDDISSGFGFPTVQPGDQ